jgi:hypothetical protein
VPADKADGRSSASPSDDPIAYATPDFNKLALDGVTGRPLA